MFYWKECLSSLNVHFISIIAKLMIVDSKAVLTWMFECFLFCISHRQTDVLLYCFSLRRATVFWAKTARARRAWPPVSGPGAVAPTLNRQNAASVGYGCSAEQGDPRWQQNCSTLSGKQILALVIMLVLVFKIRKWKTKFKGQKCYLFSTTSFSSKTLTC